MNKLFVSILVLLAFLGSAQGVPTKLSLLTSKDSKSRPVQIVMAPKFSEYKSYRQWKNEKIQLAIGKLNLTRAHLDSRKLAQAHGNNKTEASSGVEVGLSQLETQMRLDLMSIEMAKDLTVTDYFVGYVNKIQEKKEFINDIAAKMSAEEVAELMTAYAQSIFGRSSLDAPKSALKQTDKEASK